jgi:hypothetical protein
MMHNPYQSQICQPAQNASELAEGEPELSGNRCVPGIAAIDALPVAAGLGDVPEGLSVVVIEPELSDPGPGRIHQGSVLLRSQAVRP